MLVLVDMDGVIADFEQGFLDTYMRLHPDKPYVPIGQRKSFYITDDYPAELSHLVNDILHSEGFFYGLNPIDGAIESLNNMAEKHDVFICSTPLLKNPTCVQEKYDWVKDYMGDDWTKKIILTSDKTIIDGDILIDDRPDISGISTPNWEQIIYTQPYNVHIRSMLRITWGNWLDVLGPME
jgi:5'-nucleotidase